MPGKKTFALFILAFGATLIATAPASLLGAWLNQSSRGSIELANSEGTLWHGSAIPVFHSPHGNHILMEQVNWKLSVLPIISGKINLLVSQGRTPQASITAIEVGIKSIELQHVTFELPAEVLEEIHPLLQALHPQGNLSLTSEHLTLAGDSLRGAATAQWLSASSTFSMVNPFGSYQINLNGTGTQIALNLTTLSGPLLLDGQGEWSFAKGLTIDAHASASAGKEEALAELLHHLGPEISPGTRLIKIGNII